MPPFASASSQAPPAGGSHGQQLGAGRPRLRASRRVAEQLPHGVAAAGGDGAPCSQRLLPALVGGVGPARQGGTGGGRTEWWSKLNIGGQRLLPALVGGVGSEERGQKRGEGWAQVGVPTSRENATEQSYILTSHHNHRPVLQLNTEPQGMSAHRNTRSRESAKEETSKGREAIRKEGSWAGSAPCCSASSYRHTCIWWGGVSCAKAKAW